MRRLVSIYIVGLLLSLLGCGAGGSGLGSPISGPSGGNDAAPTGGSGTPVAVELPSVQDVGDLVYITGQVMGSTLSMSHSSKSLSVGAAHKGIDIKTLFAKEDSLAACETANQFWEMDKIGSQSDLTLCIVQTDIAPAAKKAGIDIADGADHDFAVTVREADGSTSQLDLRLSLKTEDGEFKMQSCAGGKQIHYTQQTIDGSKVRIHSKDIKADGREEIRVDGEINTEFQYTQKTISSQDVGEKKSGGYSHNSVMEQFPHSAILDGFRTFENNGSEESARLYSAFDLNYAGSSILPDPTAYLIGNGAAHYKAYGTMDVTECWNSETQEKDDNACGPYLQMVQGQPLKEVAPVVIEDYTDEEAITCSEISPAMKITLDLQNHPCAQFMVQHEDVDCVNATQGDFDVSASMGGVALSENPEVPSILEKSDVITLTSNYAAYPESFFKGTIVIQPFDGTTALNYSAQLDLGNTTWNDSHTQFSMQPSLQSRTIYQLTLVGSNGLAGAGNKNKMPTNHVYYFIVR